MTQKRHPQTLAIRGGKAQTEYLEHNQALFLTSSFMWESAEHAEALFAKKVKGFTYTRTANPTIAAFEERISALEGAERSVATSTGMSAIQAAFFTFLKAGDHVVSSRNLFGTTAGFINGVVTKFGIEVTLVSQTDLSEWQAAVKENTKLFFLETPSNPLGEVADLRALSEMAHAVGALLVVDNSLMSPVGQQPLALGADISVQSATKAIDGHGRVMGGVLSGSEELMGQVAVYCNSCGLAMSPFNAWNLLSGVETLSVRMEKQFANALQVAQWLQTHAQVKAVYYAGLPEHPQADLVAKQQNGGGIVIGFEVENQEKAWSVINRAELFSRTANLGDVRSTITHPWTTTHGRMSPEDKLAANIRPGLVRLSVGLEYADDLIADLQRALA
ncbi:O-succinylhomoserine sulfhydrylase [Neisseria animalis]|uniref:O-succinylhomoserine sulfhydrylase n=1 Tax=Neisseria animalis TaxID=492 RepID=A0A5P3MPC5_NEIAN|nr:O-succinylhomoserine sulfhydrylase [Neisseria animalis]QEY23383.1 O-succinylhomoserine sulfhydrylase [Neisseria animalis]ROW33375.1 O-succinylhomoserine sulfhydrylase [Neisseria animalis]VEE08814.1 putative O-succinylhomoserine sulfhydrolase [Neisseria animalis]